MLPCSWKRYLGIECPSCGAQRSFLELVQGEVVDSFLLFPALIPLLIVIILTIIHLIKPSVLRPIWIVRFFVLTASVMLVSWLIKLI